MYLLLYIFYAVIVTYIWNFINCFHGDKIKYGFLFVAI